MTEPRDLTDKERHLIVDALRRAAEASRATASTIIANGRFTMLSEDEARAHRRQLLEQSHEEDRLASALADKRVKIQISGRAVS